MASDDGVRSTNDDAAQCKRFAVEKGYWKDPYISLFTPRGKQTHAPEINIGYYARVKGLRVFLDKFLALTSGACQIVSFGAGFDTLYWNLKDEGLSPTSFIEVDFSAVTAMKIAHIRRGKSLLERISNEDGEIKLSTTDLHGKDYHLVSANLKNLKELEHKLHECDIDYSMPTIFIAECVLVYIEKNKTDDLLKWITEHFTSAFFVNYEQVNMIDKFGQIMMDNLAARECVLHTEYCTSLQSQIDRFTKLGWEGADAMEMRHVLASLPQADVQRIEKLELLDERELLDQLMSHYCYSWAYKDSKNIGLSEIDFT